MTHGAAYDDCPNLEEFGAAELAEVRGEPRGVEHAQADAIKRLANGDARDITPNLINPTKKTPNQKALAAAIFLSAARIRPKEYDRSAAVRQTLDLFSAMNANGHQAVGPDYGDEQGCPDPHSALWAMALWSILREGDLQGLDLILEPALNYHASHMAMCAAFWTPRGVRIPGSRAKCPPGMELRPNWTLDSRIYSDLSGEPLPKEPCDWDTVRLARAESSQWKVIRRRARRASTRLVVPVRRWNLEAGGYTAALDHDVPMNDRLSWLTVDPTGNILAASNTLSNFEDPGRTPDLVFGA